MKRIHSLVLTIAALLLAGTLAYWAGTRRQPDHAAASAPRPEAPPAPVLYWYDPMVPDQHFDKPGLSPMGMQMVPKLAATQAAKNGVHIDPSTVQNLGVRTALVERRRLDGDVHVPGTITWDLRQATTVSARVDAVIAKLNVRAPYTPVATGAPLVELLAPQWSSAVAEYEALQHTQSADAKALRNAAQERLRVLGLTPDDLRAMGRGNGPSTITVHAPQAGMVTSIEVREGQRVAAGQTLMTINGLDTVWIEAALPQAVAGSVQAGTPATIHVDALPGRFFQGKVETLLPDIDAATRTQRARIVLANPDGKLSPGMFAHVDLAPAQEEPVVAVPDDALIAVGDRMRVIVAEGEGHFRPTAVRTGRSAGGYTQVLSGLDGTERVVVSGQFLIDSEASLSGALERLDDGAAQPAPTTTAPMPGMSMGDQP